MRLQAEQLFEWGLRRNSACSLCHSNLGDVRLKLDEPEKAEASLRAQLALLPLDADARLGLQTLTSILTPTLALTQTSP